MIHHPTKWGLLFSDIIFPMEIVWETTMDWSTIFWTMPPGKELRRRLTRLRSARGTFWRSENAEFTDFTVKNRDWTQYLHHRMMDLEWVVCPEMGEIPIDGKVHGGNDEQLDFRGILFVGQTYKEPTWSSCTTILMRRLVQLPDPWVFDTKIRHQTTVQQRDLCASEAPFSLL